MAHRRRSAPAGEPFERLPLLARDAMRRVTRSRRTAGGAEGHADLDEPRSATVSRAPWAAITAVTRRDCPKHSGQRNNTPHGRGFQVRFLAGSGGFRHDPASEAIRFPSPHRQVGDPLESTARNNQQTSERPIDLTAFSGGR